MAVVIGSGSLPPGSGPVRAPAVYSSGSMELFLAALAAVAVVVSAWAFSRLTDATARERRLSDELAALRRALATPAAPRGSGDPSVSGIHRISISDDEIEVPGPGPAAEAPAPAPALPASEPLASAEELAALATEAEAAAEILSDMDAVLSEMVPPDAGEGLPTPRAAAPAPRTALPALAASLDEVSALVVSLGGERSRLKELLVSVEAAAGRLAASARGGHALVEQAERQALSVAPAAASLSGLSDRMNLLALNIALLATRAGEAGGPFTESGEELRGLFEEARTLSREIGSLAQRAAGAARRAGEPLADLVALAEGTGGRASRAAAQVDRLDELTLRLDETVAAARQAADGIDAEERDERREEGLRAAAVAEREERERERAERAEGLLRSLPAALDGLSRARAALAAVSRELRRAGDAGPS